MNARTGTPRHKRVKRRGHMDAPRVPDLDENGAQPVWREISQVPPFRLNALLFMAFGVIAIALQGFWGLEFPNLYAALWERKETMFYSFQVPVALAVGAFLGPGAGTTAVLVYVFAGLFLLPLFANGGVVEGYHTQPGFGYLVGLIFGAWCAAWMAQLAFTRTPKGRRSLTLFLAGIAGVLVVHAIGATGLIVQTLAGTLTTAELEHWWTYLGASPLAYDLLTTLPLLGLVRFLRLACWIALY